MSVGMVRREAPVPNSCRRAVYELNDGIFRFRHGVLEGVLSYVRSYDSGSAYKNIEKMLPEFMESDSKKSANNMW